MNIHFVTITLVTLLLLGLPTVGIAQNAQDSPYPNPQPLFPVLPRYSVLPSTLPSGKQLVQWNGSFTDLTHVKRPFTMVGTDPSKTNVTTTVTTWIIPIKIVFGAGHGNKTFDPLQKVSNGKTVIQNTLASPLFSSGFDFKIGKVDLGSTQYIDAFERGTWWGKGVEKNNKYHVLLKPVIKPEQTINCTDATCVIGTEFGITVGLAGINFYDTQVVGFMSKLGVTPDILPLFVFYGTYLTNGGCCIGGYHFTLAGPPGGQTYANATYIDKEGAFADDVGAMSHELGEWMDDPFGNNADGCHDNTGGLMEVGDPLENMPNFGTFPYKLHGFTFHLQSLVFMGYFGAPRSDSANHWLAFRNDEPSVCPGE